VIQLDYRSGGIGLATLSDFVPDTVSAAFAAIQADLDAGKIQVKPFTGE
jgi:hypothetical protein